MDAPRSGLFRGSELPRLLVLGVLMIAGWGLVWQFARAPEPAANSDAAGPRVTAAPQPVEPDSSPEFETVTDRTPMSFRDNAAFALLLERVRQRSHGELAQESRRDILLTHLWERPELYRGVPIHLLGSALRVLRYESKLSQTGWLYEAWIVSPDARTYPYACVFEEAPEGFPLGPDLAERVVFNGYFLKILRYQAGDVPRGAPLLIGRIGWDPQPSAPPAGRSNRTLYWSLVILAVLFLISLGRWSHQLFRALSSPRRPSPPSTGGTTELSAEELRSWLESIQRQPHEENG
jgi:hypothetical protein